ncbi:MAG: hypothetical protein HQK55_03205 [Deltaproteobacteria bacterium]|nr:hypothetical protein [Deltaproteobacteria bacterium]
MTKFPPLDTTNLTVYSIKDRRSKVSHYHFARPWSKDGSLADFFDRLPDILAAGDFRQAVNNIVRAVRDRRTIILAMGGHPVKVGLSPLIIDLMRRGVISLLAVNGSVMVHDTEVAMIGSTSEDVAATLGTGNFGMGREANELINTAAQEARQSDIGLGQALGRRLLSTACPYGQHSLFASAVSLDIPITVHVALGTDVYHIHPQADGAAIGQASMTDFRTFCAAVATLDHGVFINLGSAVIIPEVFLKALTLVRNLGHPLPNLTTINMDFMRHYRPQVNIVQRPTLEGGQGYYLIGHHEIMFPLLAAAVIERIEEPLVHD